MITNEVLEAIRDRQMVFKFKDEPLEDEQVEAVLRAGSWTESYGNCEPRQFLVIDEAETKKKLSELTNRLTSFTAGIENAPVTIAIAVTGCGSSHYIEEGAGAAHNMALAAHSLGLGSYWIDVYDLEDREGSVEAEAKSMLGIPEDIRLAYLLPLGKPDQERDVSRARLDDLVHYNRFGSG